MIIDLFTNGCVGGSDPMAYSMTLDDVEAWVEDDQEPAKLRMARGKRTR